MLDGFFASLAAPWVAHGANALPIAPGAKKPDVTGWGKPGDGPALHSPESPKVPASTAPRHRDLNCAVLVGSLNATVIDVDDLDMLPQVIAVCGDTPFRTTSGRVGGGVHLWYQGECSTPRNGVCPGVDIKSTGGYVLAPGSIHHKTGKPYRASPALATWLASGSGIEVWPRPRPDWRGEISKCRPRLVNPSRVELGILTDGLKSRGSDRTVVPMLRAVAAGKRFADPGSIDSALYHCLRVLADSWPFASEAAMQALFAPSFAAMVGDREPTSDDLSIKWQRLAGCAVDDEAARAAGLAAAEAAGVERARVLRARAHRWVGVDSDAVCTAGIGADALPVLLHYGRTYYLRVGEGWVGPWVKDDLAPDVLAALSAVYEIDLPDLAALLVGYAARPARVRSSLSCARSTYDPITGELVIAVAPRDPALVPEFSRAVSNCIAAWGGQYAAQLELWLAGVLRTDLPCRALILSGDGNAGKSLILSGLSQLWPDGAPKMRDVLGKRFNSAIGQAPLAIADDDAGDGGETGVALAAFLREGVQDRRQRLERKGIDVAVVQGSMRYAVATNDAFDLISGAVSYMADTAAIDAYGDRILHIPVPASAALCWEREGLTPADIVEGQALARHVLWLHEIGLEHVPDDRFWVGAADPVLAARAVLCSGLRGEILVRMYEGMSGLTNAPMSKSWVRPMGTSVLVQARNLLTSWTEAPRGATARSVGLCLAALSRSDSRAGCGGKYAGGERWHAVPTALVEWYAERAGA